MAATFIYKPATTKGPVVLVPDNGPRTPPVITLPNGQQITGRYLNTNEGRHQFVFPTSIYQFQDMKISYGGQESSIPDGRMALEGSSIGGWGARAGNKGSLGVPSSGYSQAAGGRPDTDGIPDQFTPGNIGYGSTPAYLGNSFPSPTMASFNSIKGAKYKHTDPLEYAATVGDFNRGEIAKNFTQASAIGQAELDAELKGLAGFTSAAGAIQRGEIAKDNPFNQGQAANTNQFARGETSKTNQFARTEIAKTNPFNQSQRTQQLDTALPGVRQQLADQGQRAETFAGGRLTSDIEDRAFEVGVRSRAADSASVGGFGAQSSVARKTSDLMSAEQRLNLSKYGDQLLGTNITQRTNVELAPTEYAKTEVPKTEINPTEYANVGSQIKVMPTVDLGTRIANNLTETNNRTILNPDNLLTSEIQQNQFEANYKTGIQEFNATGNAAASAANAAAANNFALSQFGYNTAYAGAVAGAGQVDTNTTVAKGDQDAAAKAADDAKKDTQNANNVSSIVQGVITAGTTIMSVLSHEIPSSSSLATGNTSSTPLVQTPALNRSAQVSSTPITQGSNTTSAATPTNTSPAASTSAPLTKASATTSTPQTNAAVSSSKSQPITNLDAVASRMQSTPVSTANIKSFVSNTGTQIKTSGNEIQTARALDQLSTASSAVLNSAGVSYSSKPGYIQTGFDTGGNAIFSDAKLAASTNTQSGAQLVNTARLMTEPFSSVTPEISSKFSDLATKVSDTQFLKTLDEYKKSGDFQGFTKALTRALKGSNPSMFLKAA